MLEVHCGIYNILNISYLYSPLYHFFPIPLPGIVPTELIKFFINILLDNKISVNLEFSENFFDMGKHGNQERLDIYSQMSLPLAAG